MARQLWFQPDSTEVPNPNPWHAFDEDDPEALCKEARIRHNFDGTADVVPEGGMAHEACATIVRERNHG